MTFKHSERTGWGLKNEAEAAQVGEASRAHQQRAHRIPETVATDAGERPIIPNASLRMVGASSDGLAVGAALPRGARGDADDGGLRHAWCVL